MKTSSMRAIPILGGALVAFALTFASAQHSAAARDAASDVDVSRPVDASPLQGGAVCGDGRCSPPEDCRSCEQDCGDCCGDNRCAPPEDCRSCERDCGRC